MRTAPWSQNGHRIFGNAPRHSVRWRRYDPGVRERRRRSGGVSSARRDEILLVASRCFSLRGFDGTSMRDIADAAGLLAGSLYSHFASKVEIYEAVVARFYADFPDPDPDLDGPVLAADRLRARLYATVRRAMADPDTLSILHYDWPAIASMPELHHLVEASYRHFEVFVSLIERGVADGSLRSDLDPELVARMIPSALHGLIDPHRYPERAAKMAAYGVEDVLRTVDAVLLAGLRTGAPSTSRLT